MSIEWSPDEYHERLTIIDFENIEDVHRFYSDNLQILTGYYGVLLFMYSVFLTKV